MHLAVLQTNTQGRRERQTCRGPAHSSGTAVSTYRDVVRGRISFLRVSQGIEENRNAPRNTRMRGGRGPEVPKPPAIPRPPNADGPEFCRTNANPSVP